MLPPPAAGSEGLRPLKEDLAHQLKLPTLTNDSLRSVTEGEVLIWHLGKKSALKYSALSAQTAGTVLATSDWHMLKGFGGLGDGGLALDTSAWKSGQWHVGIDFPVPFPEGQGCH